MCYLYSSQCIDVECAFGCNKSWQNWGVVWFINNIWCCFGTRSRWLQCGSKKYCSTQSISRGKFLNSGLELMYNEHSSSVCGSMLKWLGVQKNDHTCKYSIWSKNYKNVKSFHTQHCNNVIKKFQSIGKSKCIIVLLLSMNSY